MVRHTLKVLGLAHIFIILERGLEPEHDSWDILNLCNFEHHDYYKKRNDLYPLKTS